MPKTEAVNIIPEDEPLGKEARLFLQSVLEYYANDHSVDRALTAIEHDVNCLRAAKKWYDSFDIAGPSDAATFQNLPG